jgi:excisionase family DNA binding protein
MLSMSADSPRQTVSIIEACTLVGVSRRTIYNWLSAGKLEYLRTAGGAVRILPESLFRPGKHVERVENRTA